MDFAGPDEADFANVRALNTAFLALARRGKLPRTCLQDMDPELAHRLQVLSESQAGRLATTPFLLFSFRERDTRYWDQLLDNGRSRDLFATSGPNDDGLARLIAAGLGFAWQLAKRNPYAARIMVGASLHWCERIAERTFFRLLALASTRCDVLVLRFAGDSDLWSKLLDCGIARQDSVRLSSHLSALQTVLTREQSEQRQVWPVAARNTNRSGLRIAEDPAEN